VVREIKKKQCLTFFLKTKKPKQKKNTEKQETLKNKKKKRK